MKSSRKPSQFFSIKARFDFVPPMSPARITIFLSELTATVWPESSLPLPHPQRKAAHPRAARPFGRAEADPNVRKARSAGSRPFRLQRPGKLCGERLRGQEG